LTIRWRVACFNESWVDTFERLFKIKIGFILKTCERFSSGNATFAADKWLN